MNFPFNLKTSAEFDAVGFGTNAVDFLISVPSYPAFNSKVELTEYRQAAGGEVASAMVGLQRLGLRTAYAGRFGDDAAGDIGRSSLASEGVDLRFAETVAGASTQIAFIVIDEASGERTVIWKRDSKLSYAAHEAPLEAADLCRVLHLTPHDTEAAIRLARAGRDAGAIVSIDIDNVFPGVEELLANVDVLITSANLPAAMFGVGDVRDGLARLKQRFGPAVAGVTLGEEGSLVLCGDTFVETRGFAVPGGCRDTTGAGDAFRAGILHGILTGASVEDACRIANAVAALKCRAVGARTSLPTAAELAELLASSA